MNSDRPLLLKPAPAAGVGVMVEVRLTGRQRTGVMKVAEALGVATLPPRGREAAVFGVAGLLRAIADGEVMVSRRPEVVGVTVEPPAPGLGAGHAGRGCPAD